MVAGFERPPRVLPRAVCSRSGGDTRFNQRWAVGNQSIDHDSGLTVTYPDGWSALVDPANDENMLISSPDRGWLAAFSLVRGESAQGASPQVLEKMTKMVSHPKVRNQQNRDIHGLSAYVVTGYGDKPYQYWIAAYVEHAGKVYLIRGAGSESGWGWG